MNTANKKMVSVVTTTACLKRYHLHRIQDSRSYETSEENSTTKTKTKRKPNYSVTHWPVQHNILQTTRQAMYV